MESLKVVKIGGNIINNSKALHDFLKSFAQMDGQKILVHGGGNLASKLANDLGVSFQFVNGRRITSPEMLEVLTLVFGKLNKNIIAKLQSFGCNSVGFSGADGNAIVAVKRPVKDVDFGFAGDVVQTNTETLKLLIENGVTPVFCALTHDSNGQLFNTNADTIASELAIGFANQFKTELHYCFEKKGVLQDINNEDSLIENINTHTYQLLLDKGIIADGMMPKLNNCFNAIEKNVFKVCIGKPEMLFKTNTKFTTIQK